MFASTLAPVPASSCDITAPDPVNHTCYSFLYASAAVLPTVEPVLHCATVAGAYIYVAPDLQSFLLLCQYPTVCPPFCLWPLIHSPYTQALLSGLSHSCNRSLVTADYPGGDPPSTACIYQD